MIKKISLLSMVLVVVMAAATAGYALEQKRTGPAVAEMDQRIVLDNTDIDLMKNIDSGQTRPAPGGGSRPASGRAQRGPQEAALLDSEIQQCHT